MTGAARERGLRALRRLLAAGASRPQVRRLLAVAGRELSRAAAAPADDVYGGRYYGDGRDPADRAGLSGYERYDRDTSNADVAAYLLWRHFDVHRALDVGCATGFVVEALRELGIDAEGVDVSHWAVAHPARGARGTDGGGMFPVPPMDLVVPPSPRLRAQRPVTVPATTTETDDTDPPDGETR